MKKKSLLGGTLSCLCVGTFFCTYDPTKTWAAENWDPIRNNSMNSYFYAVSPTAQDMNSPTMLNLDSFKPDFIHDRIGAEKWAEAYYKKWNNSLPSEQIKAIEELKNPASEDYHINDTLKFTNGDVNNRPVDAEFSEKTERYKRDIAAIDKALSNKAGKTSNKMYVYKDMDVFDLNEMLTEQLIDPTHPNKIDMEKLKVFKNNFTYGISSDYFIVNLSEREGGNDGHLKWRIELPAGTNTGHLDGDRLVLQRNTGLEINNVTVINQKGKEYIRIQAKLVIKDKIDERIQTKQLDLNKSWNAALGLPDGTEFIKFEVNDRYASNVIEGAGSIIHEMTSNVPNNVVKKVIDFMLAKNGKFIFTDNYLRNIPEVYAPRTPTSDVLERFQAIKGIYNEQNRTLIMKGPSHSIDGGYGMHASTLTHEFGHALDYYIGHIIGLSENSGISDMAPFKELFNKEGNNLTEYGKTNEQEFFADTFMMMHSSNYEERAEAQEKAPETVKFIDGLIKEINASSPSILAKK